jgi:hypothetical protein
MAEQQGNANEAQQGANANNGNANIAQPIILKSLSKWAVLGLDLTDSGFSKLYSKESTFHDDKVKYDLQPEKFEEYKNELIEKINHMNAIESIIGIDNDNVQRFLPKEYTLLTAKNVKDMKAIAWPEQANLPNFADQDAAN